MVTSLGGSAGVSAAASTFSSPVDTGGGQFAGRQANETFLMRSPSVSKLQVV